MLFLNESGSSDVEISERMNEERPMKCERYKECGGKEQKWE